MSDHNKYASYDLDDLRALSRRMKGVADDETLWQIEVEMARRESDEAAVIQERKRASHYCWQRWNWRHFKNWIFDNPNAPRDYRWVFSYST